jgi:probable addiction module antidote protein
MTKITIKPYDTADFLETPEDIYYYLNEVLADGDPTLIADALGNIARCKGMTAIAKKTGLNRSNLYHSLNKNGDPQISTVTKLIKSFGFTLIAVPSDKSDFDPATLQMALKQQRQR